MATGTQRAEPTPTAASLRLLVCSANTGNSAQRLRTETEIRAIIDALQRARLRDHVDVRVSLALTPARFVHELDDFRPAVVHFGGHGTRAGGLVFLGEHPDTEASVDVSLIVRLFAQLRARPLLVVLAACHSSETARALSHHVDYAIGFDGFIADDVAPAFSASLYERLASTEKVSIGHAFTLARLASVMSGYEDAERAVLFRAGSPWSEHPRPSDEPIALPRSAAVGQRGSRWLQLSGLAVGIAGLVAALFAVQRFGSTRASPQERETRPDPIDTSSATYSNGMSSRPQERGQTTHRCWQGAVFVGGGQFDGHIVDDLCVDLTEVTVDAYKQCVSAGRCTEPFAAVSAFCNYLYTDRGQHPVNCVDWVQAEEFCRHLGRRLPTEWEWEWVARGGEEARPYPWGAQGPSCQTAVWGEGGDGCGRNHTWPVGSKPLGDSREGVKDMVGNVWEWTSSSDGNMEAAARWRVDLDRPRAHPGRFALLIPTIDERLSPRIPLRSVVAIHGKSYTRAACT